MEEKKVAVLVASYNNDSFLSHALESILGQSHQLFEIIVVDDCSTDGSWELLQQYAKRDGRIHIFQNEQNRGISQTRNKLFSLVPEDVEYIAVLDSDDVMMETRLAQQVAYLESHPDVSVVGSSVAYIDERGESIRDRSYSELWCGKDAKELFNPIVANGASMFRKGVFESVGKYDDSLRGAEDYDFWLRLLSQGKCLGNIPTALIGYRLHEGQGTMLHNENHKHGFQVRWKYLWSGFFSLRGLVVTLVTGLLAILPRTIRNTVRVMAIKLGSY